MVARYREGLAGWAGEQGVRLPPELPDRTPNHHIFYLLYPDERLRDGALRGAAGAGGDGHLPLRAAALGSPRAARSASTASLPVTDRVAARLLRLPAARRCSPATDVERVVAAVRETGA